MARVTLAQTVVVCIGMLGCEYACQGSSQIDTHGVNGWHAGQVNFGYNVISVTPGMMASVYR